MKIAIGCDHAAYDVKTKIVNFLTTKNHDIIDLGTHSNESVDYPEYGHAVANEVALKKVEKGIVVCGSGIGISIAANKVKGIRAALCTSPLHAELSRKHNDANILAIGARLTNYNDIELIIDIWLKTEFDGGRHLSRIEKIEINE